MKALVFLILMVVMMWSSEASGRSYTLSVPQFYTVFSGDLTFNYSIPGNVAHPNSFVRLEFWSKTKNENLLITTMGLRLGFSSGTLRVACGVIEFAGNYTLRMYTSVNGDILTETRLLVKWPEVGLSLPDNHEAQTSSVELRIISRANCTSRLQRYFWQLKLLFRRSQTSGEMLNLSNSDVIFTTNFTSVNVSFMTFTLGCYLFDLNGVYQAVLVSSSKDSPVVANSNIMTVTWSNGYHLSILPQSAFPCQDSVTLIYTHPPCSGADKIRMYSFTPIAFGSPAAPLDSSFVSEVVADPDKTRMSFECRLFNQSANGFCFVYVSITRGDMVSEQTKACIPAQMNSVFSIDGGWSKWTSWAPCSVTCGTGRRNRFRMCNDPPPKHGGRFCVGDPMEWIPCEVHCPEAIPRTPLHSPHIDPNCTCGCSITADRGRIIGTGRCHGLSTWVVKSKDGHVIALRFDYFSLNYTRQWVKVRDGSDDKDVLLFSSFDKGYPMEVVTSGATMRVDLMTSYVTPPPVAIFPSNATLPIHANGFIAAYEVRETVISSTAPVLFQYQEETIMASTITIVGIVICAVVVIVAVVFVIVQRHFFRQRFKYIMTSSMDSPVHHSQTAGSSTEHRASSANSSSPSSPGNAIHVDMEVPLTGKIQRKNLSGKTSRTPSISSAGSQKTKRSNSKGDIGSTGKRSGSSPKPASKDYAPITSAYGIEIIDTDEKSSTENVTATKLKAPRTPLIQAVNHKHSPATPLSPITKLDMLNKKRQEKKGKGAIPEVDRDITGSSGSRSPSTTKAEVNWPQNSFVKSTLNEVSRSLTERHKHSGHRPPSEEIPLLDSMTSSLESPSHFNMVKSESTDSATTSFVRPGTNKIRRPTSLTESYESIQKLKPKSDGTSSSTVPTDTQPKPSLQEPAILQVHSVQFSSSIAPTSFVNNKHQPAPWSILSLQPKRPLKPSPSQASISSEKSAIKQTKSAFEERQTILPKPDGQSPKLQKRETASAATCDKEPTSPGKASKASSKSSKNTISSPARSIATPSEIEGLELEYDDFIEDDPLSYFDYEETQKLAFRGVEKIGKTPVDEEDEDEDAM